MNKLFSTLGLTMALTACSASSNEKSVIVGGTQDHHGCLTAAGQSYSFLKQSCVQVFDIADIRLTDPANQTLAVYTILSQDKQQAEVFAADLPENTILEAVKGGYASKDGKVRLMKTKQGWTIQK